MCRAERMVRTGFTLVEILVVLFVISTLMALVIPGMVQTTARADAARIVRDVRTVQTAIAQFESDWEEALPPSSAWGEPPEALAAYLPEGFAFSYKGAEYKWTSAYTMTVDDGAEGEGEDQGGGKKKGFQKTSDIEVAGLWVRYPEGSAIAAALQAYNGSMGAWSPGQMLFTYPP